MAQSSANASGYIRRKKCIILAALHIDSLLVTYSNLEFLMDTKQKLGEYYKMLELGESQLVLGVVII